MSPPESSAAGPTAERTPEVTPPASPQATPEPTARKAEERVSIRKKRAIRLGRKIARVTIGPTKETFAVHEELLCASSPYFRERLQKDRKPVEGECSICHEDMHDEDEEIVFCRTCGGNIHHGCMKKWEDQNQSDDSETEANCPLCRSEWVTDNHSCACPQLDAKSFSMYTEWLYSTKLPIGDASKSCATVFGVLSDTWQFGRIIGDKKFLNAILHAGLEAIQDTEKYPAGGRIHELYALTTADCDLRKLLVRVYAKRAKVEWFQAPKSYPAEFLKDMTMALLRERVSETEPFETCLETLHAAIDAGEGL